MVDYESYFKYGPSEGRNGFLNRSPLTACACTDCTERNKGLAKRYRTQFDKMATSKEWDDEQYLLCPPRVLGYVLEEKRWAQLQVMLLDDIDYDQSEVWKSRLRLGDDDDTEKKRKEHNAQSKRASKKGGKGERLLETATRT
jgi:hypothetical protein